jgi:hypothetical protein
MKEVVATDQEFSRPLSGITDQETIDVNIKQYCSYNE